MQESDDLNECKLSFFVTFLNLLVLESIEKLEKLNVLSSDPLEPSGQNNQIMDELLKDTLVANESPASIKHSYSPSLSPNIYHNKSPSQFTLLKNENERKEEKEEDYLESMIRNFDKEENNHRFILENDKKMKINNKNFDELDPETLLKEFEENEKVFFFF